MARGTIIVWKQMWPVRHIREVVITKDDETSISASIKLAAQSRSVFLRLSVPSCRWISDERGESLLLQRAYFDYSLPYMTLIC